ncbi:MAG TPA: 16S rRNA (guanine(966)-N(2))-methyltransferase RsmD [Solirubrobacteraceae bacterium]|jgi:16S rRNA (guanine(966)-N(2))-methyltransferase RsmD|nr:16S rRNA (guanine(966)-N(2))-methyltransferase RsmD [Solirubrobacteraceae bacterium]
MRLTGGALGGRRLVAPRGERTRPTSDRVREALFAILGPLDGADVLDLFAGSGALGLEALSRGATEATFVDAAPAALHAVRRNLEALDLRGEVRRADARAFLRNAQSRGRSYDLILLDPPYRLAAGLGRELSEAVPPVLKAGGRVVVESDRRSPLELELPLLDERRYGDTTIRIHGSRPT